MGKKVVFFGIKAVFISLIFIALFKPEWVPFLSKWRGVSIQEIWDALRQVDPKIAAFWLTFAAVVKMAGIFAGILRWRILLRAQGLYIPFWYLTKCWFMGRAIGLFLPGTVGLDGYKLVETSAYTGEVVKCTSVALVEKLIGIVNLFLLVFLTVPLGMRLFNIDPLRLGIVLFVLLGFIIVSLTLLLQPRIVQVIVGILPTPAGLRDKIDSFGEAVTAYRGHRGSLFAAIVLGFFVHLGIVFMYFGNAMTITGGNVEFLDLLFASPLTIVGSVFAPTVSGLGVREAVNTVLLGPKYGTAQAFIWGHLGLWVGEMIPFILSAPLLLFTARPDREEFLAKLKETREKAAESDVVHHLSPTVLAEYRGYVWSALVAGLTGGLVAGAVFGMGEALWHVSTLTKYSELGAYWWGPLVYGAVFAGGGLGVAAGLTYLYLLFDKFLKPATTFGLSLGAMLAGAFVVIGRFRFQRDILGEHAPNMAQNLAILGVALGLGIFGLLVGTMVVSRFTQSGGNRLRGLAAGVGFYVVVVVLGLLLAAARSPKEEAIAFTPQADASGPNIIYIAVDTLRADHLQAFNEEAVPQTPNVAALAKDSVRFPKTFAQSSWTKASFGTMFSGMYPEGHGATGKASALPDSIDTFAEVLQDAGYFTKGYSNNPNITGIFNYGQGFHDYTDLKPDLYFRATPSAEKMVLYDILRKVVQVISKRRGGLIRITDFYQPGEAVTATGLDWIDSEERPSDAPFLLFLHYMDPHDPFRDPENPGKGYARVQLGNPDPDVVRETVTKDGPAAEGDQVVLDWKTDTGITVHKQAIRLGFDPLPWYVDLETIVGAQAGDVIEGTAERAEDETREPVEASVNFTVTVREVNTALTYVELFRRSYNYEVEQMDKAVGDLIAGLKERGLYDNSIIVFTSDHGEEFCEHGGWWHGLSLYDEQIAVPLIVKLPGNSNGDAENPYLARHVDIAPTLARLAGAEPSEQWKGVSLFNEEMLPGNGETGYIYAHLNFEGIELRAARTQKTKLILSNENKREYAPVEFYDLESDPGEQNNLAGNTEYDESISGLTTTIESMLEFIQKGAAEPVIDNEAMQESLEELESVGYL